MKKYSYLPFVFTFIVFLASCSPKRNLVYFSDLNDSTAYTAQILNDIDPKVKADDILGITVSTLNMESNNLFNQGVIIPSTDSRGATLPSYMANTEGYLVDKEGYINFPVIGKIHLGGLTREQARQAMVNKLLESVKNPIVNVRFLNFRITVMGEVNRPGTFIVPNEKVNVLEGLGLAGDMTAYGRRENVLVIRETDGKRTMARLDMNKQDVLNSPYFYLQQNDVVYVVPHILKEKSTNDNFKIISVVLSAASVIAIIATRVKF